MRSICTGFRFKWRFFDCNVESQTTNHFVEYVIVKIPQPGVADLQSHVTIAQVISRAC